jgi:hypothetical protein
MNFLAKKLTHFTKKIEVKPQIHNLKQQMGGGHHQQQSYQHQQHYGNMGWNQNWNAGNGVGMQASAQNNGNWGTPYGSAQQWGISKAEFV